MRDILDKFGESAMSDYRRHLGKVLLARVVGGWVGDDSVDIRCNPPAKVRVVETARRDIVRECGGHLDPFWSVELIEPHPQLDGVRSLEVCGPSYNPDGTRDTTEQAGWTVEPKQPLVTRIRRWLRA